MDNNNNVKRLISLDDTRASLTMVSDNDLLKYGLQSNNMDQLKLKILRATNDIHNFKHNVSTLDDWGIKQYTHLIT